jgi:hypothetical protein
MTDHKRHNEPGSDEQMGPDRLKNIEERLDLEQAEMLEEERKTEAITPEDDPEP